MTTPSQPLDKPDFELVFNAMPGMILVLDPALTILAQTASDSVVPPR